jgi:CHASE3 domain sensor protein
LEPKLYNKLLFRLIALPVASLTLLVLMLAYALERVEQSARAVDHTDRVIAHANNLSKLMVDEETGLRGYLLTQDPVFLEPFHQADQQLEPEFAALANLVRKRQEQVNLLHSIQRLMRSGSRRADRRSRPPMQVESSCR